MPTELVIGYPSIAKVTGHDLRILMEPITLPGFHKLLQLIKGRDISTRWWAAVWENYNYQWEMHQELGVMGELVGRFWTYTAWSDYDLLLRNGTPELEIALKEFDTMVMNPDGSRSYQKGSPNMKLRALISLSIDKR